MKIACYIYYNAKCVPGNYGAMKEMEKEKIEYPKLLEYDKIIRAIWCVDKETYVNADFIGYFHCCFTFLDREFVLDHESDNTYTLQENLQNGEINYIVDMCRSKRVVLNSLKKLLKIS